MSFDHNNFLAIWGASLSTIMAFVKVYEIWRSRLRLEYSHNFSSLPKDGNDVIIRNLSGTPIIITHYELVWMKREKLTLRRKEIRKIDVDSDYSAVHVAPHASHTLSFADENHFDWSAKSLDGSAIYLRIQLAGEKRPRLVMIYQ